MLEIVEQANEPTVVEEESFPALDDLPDAQLRRARADGGRGPGQFPVEEWANGPYLSANEVELLSIRKGSLSEKRAQRRSRATSRTPTSS